MGTIENKTDLKSSAAWHLDSILFSHRLQLKLLSFDDAADVIQITNDISVARMIATIPYPFTYGDSLKLISDYKDLAGSKCGAGYIISKNKGKNKIGIISFSIFHDRADIGFWIHQKHRGNGYAKEAVLSVIDNIFKIDTVYYITAGAFFDNTTSIHIQKCVGFHQTGKSSRINRFRGGTVEHIDMRLDRNTYQKMKEKQYNQ